MTTVIAIRHGQSLSNIRMTFTGHMDSPLTELGLKQAKNTAAYLKDFPIDAIYASDLSRTIETARPLAAARGLEIVPDPRLREICGGEWEGKTGTVIAELYPEDHAAWKRGLTFGKPTGGESIFDVARRVDEFMGELLERHHGECVAIVSHAIAVRVLACRWFGYEIDDIEKVPFMTNASVSIVRYHDDGKIEIVEYGHDQHQGENVTVLAKDLA